MTREKPTRSEQREAAREKAKTLREQHKKGEQRKRMFIKLGVGVSVLAVIGVVTMALISGASKPLVEPTNMSFDDGIKIGTNLEAFTASHTPAPGAAGTATPNIQIYLDYQCPICHDFELPNQSQIESWVTSGTATIEYHPISFLDRASPNEYSSRAANAAVCVAEYSPNSFFKFNSALFLNQPAEQTKGPDNNALFKLAQATGLENSSKVESCISQNTYGAWVKKATDKALYEPLPRTGYQVKGTPFIMINDQQFVPETNDQLFSPARFAQFLQTVASN